MLMQNKTVSSAGDFVGPVDQNRVSLLIGGKTHKEWSSYDIDSDLLIPSDAWQVELGLPEGIQPPELGQSVKAGGLVEVKVGNDTVLTGFVDDIVHNITHFMGMDFIGLGDNRLDGERYSFGNIQSDNNIEAVLKGGRLQSVNILGNYRISGILKNHLLKELAGEDTLLGPVQKGLLVQNGLNREFVELIGGSTK